MKDLHDRVAAAVAHFWNTRMRQDASQGRSSGRRDHGNRTAATGGKQLDGFGQLVREILQEEADIPQQYILDAGRANVTLPGFFRPTKQWDVLVVAGKHLLASIEFKSLCGPSFGNNYNNRVEEALGSSTDIWTAYREGAFAKSPQPFLGYVLLVEEAEASTRNVKVHEKHFPVFDEFRDAPYATRCEWTLRKLVRERCYTSTSLILSDRKEGAAGVYHEAADDLGFGQFAKALCGHVKANYETIKESLDEKVD